MHVQVIQDPRLGAYEVAVYAGIAVHAELDTGRARPSLETLGTYARCSIPTVRRSIKNLESAGYIEVEHREGKASYLRLLPPPPTPVTDFGVGGDTGKPQRAHPETSARAPRKDVSTNKNQEREPRTRRRKPATALPEGWMPDEHLRSWAREHFPRVDVRLETQKFIDHAASKDRRLVDWAAGWRNWIRAADSYLPKSDTGASHARASAVREICDHGIALNPALPFGGCPDCEEAA